MAKPANIHLEVTLTDKEALRFTSGAVNRKLLSTECLDNEENCVRLAEQMVREAFRRMREKKEK